VPIEMGRGALKLMLVADNPYYLLSEHPDFMERASKMQRLPTSVWSNYKLQLRNTLKKEISIDKEIAGNRHVLLQIAAFNLILPDITKALLGIEINEQSEHAYQKLTRSDTNLDKPSKVKHEQRLGDNLEYFKLDSDSSFTIYQTTQKPIIYYNKVIEIRSKQATGDLSTHIDRLQNESDLITAWLKAIAKNVDSVPTTYNNLDSVLTQLIPLEDEVSTAEISSFNTVISSENPQASEINTNFSEDLSEEKKEKVISTADTTQYATNPVQASTEESIPNIKIPSANMVQDTTSPAQVSINLPDNRPMPNTDTPTSNAAQNSISLQSSPIEVANEQYKINIHNTISFTKDGNQYKAIGKIALAIDAYTKAIQLSSNNIEAHNNLGTLYQKQKNLEAAKQEYQTVIEICLKLLQKAANTELKHNLAIAYNNLGTVYQKQGKFADAKEKYEQAKECDPKLANPHHNLGNLLQKTVKGSISGEEQRTKYEQAESALKKAIELDPNNAFAFFNLANLQHKLGKERYDEAETNYKEAIALNKDVDVFHANLGLLYFHQARPDNGSGTKKLNSIKLELAKAEYKKAASLSTDKVIKDKIVQCLQAIESGTKKVFFIDKQHIGFTDIKLVAKEVPLNESTAPADNKRETDSLMGSLLDQQEQQFASDATL
jgi:tetratricopeptide (TPR) repeat protein